MDTDSLDGPRSFLRPKEVSKLTGYSLSNIWRLEKKGEFPQRYKLGENAVAYDTAEIQEWQRSRVRGHGRVVPRNRKP